MGEQHDAVPGSSEARDGGIRRLARGFQPYGILFAVCALVVAFVTLCAAFVTLWLEFDWRARSMAAMEEERVLRNMTIEVLVEENLLREATLLAVLSDLLRVAAERDTPYAGHVPVLERLARLRVDLRSLDLTGVRFDVDGGIDLVGADLPEVFFDGSNLDLAKFRDSDLTDASFRGAELHDADFRDAVFEGTRLGDANISGADFQGARELIQRQLSNACADEGSPPVNLPNDARRGNPLVWNGKSCDR